MGYVKKSVRASIVAGLRFKRTAEPGVVDSMSWTIGMTFRKIMLKGIYEGSFGEEPIEEEDYDDIKAEDELAQSLQHLTAASVEANEDTTDN